MVVLLTLSNDNIKAKLRFSGAKNVFALLYKIEAIKK